MASFGRKLIAGNWKMNGLQASLEQARAVAEALQRQPCPNRVAICPPATLIFPMVQAVAGSGVEVGGQNCYLESSGAFTGEISAEMLADAGATVVVLGHSERRQLFHETDAGVAAKVRAALRAGLEPIVCVGEALEQRRAGHALEVVARQVRGSCPDALRGCAFAVAYEPIWAIGSGLTPTTQEIEQVHGAIRGLLAEQLGEAGRIAPILYGGSVKPSNAKEILAANEVGGALVGGASLMAEDFLAIIRAAG
ncbi:MAG TPA: triose-phosphate isomerase [Caulobacteraceae bacterium]